MTVGIVMTVGYYRLPNWPYCENGLEHQNTALCNKRHSDMHDQVSEVGVTHSPPMSTIYHLHITPPLGSALNF